MAQLEKLSEKAKEQGGIT